METMNSFDVDRYKKIHCKNTLDEKDFKIINTMTKLRKHYEMIENRKRRTVSLNNEHLLVKAGKGEVKCEIVKKQKTQKLTQYLHIVKQ